MNEQPTSDVVNLATETIFRNTLSTLIKRKDTFLWCAIIPISFVVFLNLVFMFREGDFKDPAFNGVLLISGIIFSLMIIILNLIPETLVEKKKDQTNFNPSELLSIFLAHLVYVYTLNFGLLVAGFLVGFDFNISYLNWVYSVFFFFILTVASFSLGLILSSIRNGQFATITGVVISVIAFLYNIIILIRPNLFLMLPAVFRDIFRLNPLTAGSSVITYFFMDGAWGGYFNPIEWGQIVIIVIMTVFLLSCGIFLYFRTINGKQENIEKSGEVASFKDFAIPALAAILLIPLQYILEFIIIALIYFIPIFESLILKKTIVPLLGALIGSIIIYFVMIPFLRIKSVGLSQSGDRMDLIVSFSLFSVFWVVITGLSLFTIIFSSNFDTKLEFFTNFLSLSSNQIFDPFLLLLWIFGFVICVALFQELIYRRIVISLLENKGMSSISAVLVSSCAFALILLPFTLDFQIKLFQGSLISLMTNYQTEFLILTACYNFLTLFCLGFMCGAAYVITRNILFPILIQVLNRALIFLVFIALTLDNQLIHFIVTSIIILVNIIGILVIFAFIMDFKLVPKEKFNQLFENKSLINSKQGLLGFFIILCGLLTFTQLFPFSEVPYILGLLFHTSIIIIVIVNSRKLLNREREKENILVGEII